MLHQRNDAYFVISAGVPVVTPASSTTPTRAVAVAHEDSLNLASLSLHSRPVHLASTFPLDELGGLRTPPAEKRLEN